MRTNKTTLNSPMRVRPSTRIGAKSRSPQKSPLDTPVTVSSSPQGIQPLNNSAFAPTNQTHMHQNINDSHVKISQPKSLKNPIITQGHARTTRDLILNNLKVVNSTTLPITSGLSSNNAKSGAIILNNADSKFYGFDGIQWVDFSSGGSGTGTTGTTGSTGSTGDVGPTGST